ncbi:hypothetical protein BVI434_180006 [Burkholderia vietnamiensis]|nr:hypothetical protein BVI434_180006 [Burkholderia vietnamiensis]
MPLPLRRPRVAVVARRQRPQRRRHARTFGHPDGRPAGRKRPLITTASTFAPARRAGGRRIGDTSEQRQAYGY